MLLFGTPPAWFGIFEPAYIAGGVIFKLGFFFF